MPALVYQKCQNRALHPRRPGFSGFDTKYAPPSLQYSPSPHFMTVMAGKSSVHLAKPSPNHSAAEGTHLPDALLVDRLRLGEAPAGESLVRKYYQPLVRYLQRLVG